MSQLGLGGGALAWGGSPCDPLGQSMQHEKVRAHLILPFAPHVNICVSFGLEATERCCCSPARGAAASMTAAPRHSRNQARLLAEFDVRRKELEAQQQLEQVPPASVPSLPPVRIRLGGGGYPGTPRGGQGARRARAHSYLPGPRPEQCRLGCVWRGLTPWKRCGVRV